MKFAGVYKIKIGMVFYIGSSENMDARWKSHLYHLKLGAHTNRVLQSAYDKEGGAEVDILEKVETADCVDKAELRERIRSAETKFIQLMANELGMCNRYLSAKGALRRDDMKERWKDPEFRERTTASIRAKLALPETRKKISDGAKRAIREKGILPKNSRPIHILTPDGDGRIFESISQAASHIGVSNMILGMWLRGKSPFPGTGKTRTQKHLRRLIGYTIRFV